MLKILPKHPLASYTTLRIGATAEYFAVVHDREEVLEAIAWAKARRLPIMVLGGGSNLLITKPVRGLVLKNEIKGIAVAEKRVADVLVEAKSGEEWARFVDWTVSRGLYGLENLSLIYGTVGAAPVQNIGAYGSELKDAFYHLRAIDLKTGHEKIFSAADCRFGYRDSVFKHRQKGKYFIYAVTFRLSRTGALRLDYGAIRARLEESGRKAPRLKDVAAAVKDIRRSKLPDPSVLPNAGSFFKNPETSAARLRTILQKYPDMPHFAAAAGKHHKIPAGWLIEKAGFRGRRLGPVGMYKNQALVLVNYRRASAKQVLTLVSKVRAAVKRKFGLDLEPEVNII